MSTKQLLENAFGKCKEYIENNPSDTELASYLTAYMVILVYTYIEEEVIEIISSLFSSSVTRGYEKFTTDAINRLLRSIKTSEIKDFLNNYIDSNCKENFSKNIEGNLETAFNNIIYNRHMAAHQGHCNMTYQELIKHYNDAQRVLEELRKAISAIGN